MKNSKNLIAFIICVLMIMRIGSLNAQTNYKISGRLTDETGQPVMFANIALWQSADSSIMAGTVSDETGAFELSYNQPGTYRISVSCISYVPFQKNIELKENGTVDLGKITLVLKASELNEVVVRQERIKAKQQSGKTTYYVNSGMKKTSGNGMDMMRHIPGIQIDLLQNITLNGSGNIIILINGIERDAAFLSQLNPDKIDRIEIKNSPGAEYNAEITGVINILLKKNENTGISGHVYANIPTNSHEVFSFPTASLNYTFDKLTLYSSYNGAFSFFDIKTEDKRVFSNENEVAEVIKTERLHQQNWSHKWHVGADYFLNENNRLNVYGFISRFSNEQSGVFNINEINNSPENDAAQYKKDDYDINHSAYASVFYKHIFAQNAELSFDADYYALESKNRLRLSDLNGGAEQVSRSEPRKNLLKARLNFRFPVFTFMRVKTGFEHSINYLSDDLMPEFSHIENTSSFYISVNYNRNKIQANAGIRAEYLQYDHAESKSNQLISLPALNIKYQLSNSENFRFSFRKSIARPHIFQLNPNVQSLDFYTTQKGNPKLKPVLDHTANLDYSLSFGNNFLTAGLFYTHKADVIERLTVQAGELFLEKEIQNLGSIHQFGINTSGSFKLHKRISLRPRIKLYCAQTQGNDLAQAHHIENKQALNFESAVSAVLLMNYDFSFSASAQFNSRLTRIQNDYRDDALYFISLNKTFFEQFKLSITSAVPFKNTFTYQSYDIAGRNFNQTTEDNIQISVFPVWFKLSYSFASGKKAKRIERDDSFEENRLQKGF